MGPGGTAEKKNNVLPLWGNEKTMNLNNMILTNILSSHYFKVNLYQLKTYHEVVDEIFYHVSHLEPWEKGSRKTSGQTGMCGGVRGVGAGGIVSTAFCILYKLFTLKLTRKQLLGLLVHRDSPYIRGLGFMYIRYTQPPADLWEWFEPYLDDDEALDVKAGGGQIMSMGEILRHMLSKLEWYATLFPRIPVPIQKDLERKLATLQPLTKVQGQGYEEQEEAYEEQEEEEEQQQQQQPEIEYNKKREELPWAGGSSAPRNSRDREDPKYRSEKVDKRDSRERYHRSRSPSHSRHHRHHRSRSRTKSNSELDRSGSRDRRHHHNERHHNRHHSHRSRRYSPSRESRHHHRSHH